MTAAGRPIDTAIQLMRDPLDAMWRILRAPATARVLLLLLGAAVLLGQVVPQMPADVGSEPAALARWTADQPTYLRPHIGWMRALGLLDLYHALGFRALMGLLALSLLVVLGDQLLKTWDFARSDYPCALVDAHAGRRWELSARPLEDLARALSRDLWTRRYLVLPHWGEGEATLRAERWPAMPLAHLGGLVLLAGLALNAGFGWRLEGVALPPGRQQAIEGDDYALMIEPILVGAPGGADDAERLTVWRGEKRLSTGILRPGETFHVAELSIRHRSLGDLVTVSGSGSDGGRLRLEPYPRQSEVGETLELAFTAEQTERYFTSLGSGQVYQVSLDEAGMVVAAYRKGQDQPAITETLSRQGTVELDGERIAFSLGRYVVLDVSSDPAWFTMVGGGLLALTGIALSLICRPSRMVWHLREVSPGIEVERSGLDPYDGLGWPALAEPDPEGSSAMGVAPSGEKGVMADTAGDDGHGG